MVKPRQAALAVQGDLWLGRKGKAYLSANRIDLLESIDRLGSITHAAKDVGLSYKAAWDAVDAMSNLADRPLVIRATGGPQGGGSHLTEHGRELVRLYRLLQSGYHRLLTQMQAQVHDFDKLNELIRAITMKTSARNQFRGTVKAVHKGAVNADVVLDIGDGLEIFANITNDAIGDLGLKRGRAVNQGKLYPALAGPQYTHQRTEPIARHSDGGHPGRRQLRDQIAIGRHPGANGHHHQ